MWIKISFTGKLFYFELPPYLATTMLVTDFYHLVPKYHNRHQHDFSRRYGYSNVGDFSVRMVTFEIGHQDLKSVTNINLANRYKPVFGYLTSHECIEFSVNFVVVSSSLSVWRWHNISCFAFSNRKMVNSIQENCAQSMSVFWNFSSWWFASHHFFHVNHAFGNGFFDSVHHSLKIDSFSGQKMTKMAQFHWSQGENGPFQHSIGYSILCDNFQRQNRPLQK